MTRIYLDPENYIFVTSALGTLFNVTVKVEDVYDMETWQLVMYYDDSVINVTRWYEPAWDPDYVFYGRTTLPVPSPPDAKYERIGLNNGSAGVGSALFPAPSPGDGFTGDGTLCILTFNITAVPPEGKTYSCALDIDTPKTFWVKAGETVKRYYDTYTNGDYEITVVLRPHGYLVVRGKDNKIYYRAGNGTSWESWIGVAGATVDSPAAEVFDKKLHIVVRGMDGTSLWHGYVNLTDGSFLGWTLIPGATPSPPTLTASATELYLVVRGLNDVTYYSAWNGTAWTRWTDVPGATAESPAAAVLDNNLHIVVKGMHGNLWHGYVNLTDSTFSGWTRLPGATPSAPTLTASATKLYLVVRGNDDRIYHNSWNGTSWQGWTALPRGATPDSPSAAVLGNNLHIVVRGLAGASLWHAHIDLSTYNFVGWSLLTGLTPSAPELAT